MNYPQTEAMNLSVVFPECERLKQIANNSCLAMCYLHCIGIEAESIPNYLRYITDSMDKGFLDSDCTVLNAEKFLKHFSGKEFSVIKKDVSKIDNIKKLTPVRFDFNNKQHWVVVENGRIVFNPLLNSLCVAKGKPTTARIINLK